jgi:hypothetical protein
LKKEVFKMKRLLAIFLAFVMVFGFTACGGGEDEDKNSSVIEFEGSKAEYIGSELTKDADGNDAVLVTSNIPTETKNQRAFSGVSSTAQNRAMRNLKPQ